MTALVVLGTLAVFLLLPLAATAARHRTLVAMALRNIARRRSEALLVVGGALLGTAIITSSFVVGDIVENAFADEARTRFGPIDLTVTPVAGTDFDVLVTAVEAAEIDGVHGLLATTTATATLEAPARATAVPRLQVVELDLAEARDFGSDPHITGVAGVGSLGTGEILVNDRTAGELDVAAGDVLRLHAFGAAAELTVAEVVAEVGLAGYGGAIVAPGTLADLAGDATLGTTPPHHQLLVSLEGGVFDTRTRSDAAASELRRAVAGLPGAEVEAPKAAVIDDARRDGAEFTELFSGVGSFSVLAGVLLLVNLFVMLAEERKTELGVLRALGFTRRRLTRAFAIEGALYALVAAVIGAALGLGLGWLVAALAGVVGVVDSASGYPLVVEPTSLAIGATAGLVISLVTIWATSLRIARLNVIRAIRDLPEPPASLLRPRTLVLAASGVLMGATIGVAGYFGDDAFGLLLGVPVAAFSATPLLRRLLPERTARLLAAGTVLVWGLAALPLFRDVVGAADVAVFVVQGMVLTAGAVSVAASLDRVWVVVIERLGRGGRLLALRLGVAYPLARRFRTSMLLGMFSLVVFTVTLISAMSATFDRSTDAMVADIAAGFDVVLDENPTRPLDAETLTARDDVVEAAGLTRGVAAFGAAHLEGTRPWPVTGFDADLLARQAPGLLQRDESYPSDVDAYRAVRDDPTLVIVPDLFLIGAAGVQEVAVGDTVTVVDPAGGPPHELTVAGLYRDWLGNGALVSREATGSLIGARDLPSRTYLAVADGVETETVAADLNATHLADGADARTFTAIVGDGMRRQQGSMSLVQGFLGLGLLVGIAGLGVVMVRAVRERRQEIGVLRAMGLSTGTVRAALLSEAGLVATQGTVIGAVLGLITTHQLLTSSQSFGDGQMPFVVPWGGLAVILAIPLVAAVATATWPASRAAAVRPAVALRTTD